MAGDDPVDNISLIFTEADVFYIAGYLANLWGCTEDTIADVEEAIKAALTRGEDG